MGYIVITSLLLYTFIILFNTRWCSCNVNSPNNLSVRCKPSERAALLNFKHNFTYFDKDVSSSWEGEECCNWTRVVCDNTTGHILELSLYGDRTNYLLKMEKLESLVYLLELRQLKSLDLSNNDFNYSSIPRLMGSMKQLRYLDLSNASLGGPVPYELGNLTNLESLFLLNNQLSGKIPTSIGKLSKLQILDIAYNPLEGTVLSESHFVNLSSLTDLYMDHTMLTLNLSSDWVPPFQLEYFYADNCKINGQLPPWLQTQKSLVALFLSNANISGPFPDGLGHLMPNLSTLFLPGNQLSGQIPNSLCQPTLLNFIDISNNSISGEIPNCFANLSSLSFVGLSYNKLTGHIPCFNNTYSDNSFGSHENHLHLNDNMLSGEIPSCLSNLTNLKVLDIGENQLLGKMFKWFNAKKFRELQIFRLRGNKFSGTIPKQVCSLPHLQIMDFAHNHFTGGIPRCLSNLTSMTSPNTSQVTYVYDVSEVIQGIEYVYTSTLPYLVDIDLSFNNLAGSIPDDMTKISGLLNLNLSYNQLSGTIPVNIGGLKSLVSLDLSNNKLMGSIPTSIGQIHMLSHLNLSYNNLSGQIPTGNQLQTLSDQASIYAGNPYLCGDFLPKKCKSKVDEQDNKGRSKKVKGNNKEKLEKMGFGLVVMSGFATGFWGVVGSLALNRRWRHAVFQRVEDGYNWLYVIVAVRVAKVRRNNRR